jgi:hypothetical protein
LVSKVFQIPFSLLKCVRLHVLSQSHLTKKWFLGRKTGKIGVKE